jgi:glycosyltransferase involved in cell wall biosynthesis
MADKRKINILIFEPYLFNKYGNVRYIISIFKFINKHKYRIKILTTQNNEFVHYMNSINIECDVLAAPKNLQEFGQKILKARFIKRANTFFSIIKYNLKLLNYIKNNNIEIVQCHSIRALLTICFAVKLSKRYCFWYIKGDLANPILDRIGFMLSDRILFQCNTNKNRKYPKTIKMYGRKIGILFNGIDLAPIKRVLKRNKCMLKTKFKVKNGFNIIYLGQVYPLKGIEFLLKAISLCNISNLSLYIVGDHCIDEYKNYKKKLDDLINCLELKNVIFMGYREDALELLSIMDLLVHPSLSEGMPKSVTEALALGVPVIATRVGGTEELLKENGVLVNPGNEYEISNAIMRFYSKPDFGKDDFKKNMKLAQNTFSINNNIIGLEKLYSKLMIS